MKHSTTKLSRPEIQFLKEYHKTMQEMFLECLRLKCVDVVWKLCRKKLIEKVFENFCHLESTVIACNTSATLLLFCSF